MTARRATTTTTTTTTKPKTKTPAKPSSPGRARARIKSLAPRDSPPSGDLLASIAARALAKQRWAGTTPEERSAALTAVSRAKPKRVRRANYLATLAKLTPAQIAARAAKSGATRRRRGEIRAMSNEP